MAELALITGASRGIGLATAARFLEAGAAVWNLSRTPCPLENVRNFTCDLSDSAALNALIPALDLSPFKRVTLVHNAAMTRQDNVATLSDEAFLETFRLNVLAPQIINRHLIGAMPPASAILFIGSTLSEASVENRLSYVATKHALAGLMKATCRDIGIRGIHTCLIAPGFTDTQMLREAVGGTPGELERARNRTILGRLVAPAEIAELVLFCSRSPSVNGSVLHANLGHK